MTYVETPADAAFTAFLSRVTPRQVRRDREGNLSRSELKIRDHIKALGREQARRVRDEEIAVALELARLMREKDSHV